MPLLNALSESAINTSKELGARDLGSIAWSFATLSIADMPLLNALS